MGCGNALSKIMVIYEPLSISRRKGLHIFKMSERIFCVHFGISVYTKGRLELFEKKIYALR